MHVYVSKKYSIRITNIPFIFIVLRSFLTPLLLLRRGVLLFSLLLLLVDFTSIALSRVVILFFNYTIFLILYSLEVSTNANSKNG